MSPKTLLVPALVVAVVCVSAPAHREPATGPSWTLVRPALAQDTGDGGAGEGMDIEEDLEGNTVEDIQDSDSADDDWEAPLRMDEAEEEPETGD